MTAIFPHTEQAKLQPLVSHVSELTALAPGSPALIALAHQVAEILSAANYTKPRYDAELGVFWLIP